MLPFGRNDRPHPLFLKSDNGELIDVAIHPPLDCKSGLTAQVPSGLNSQSPSGLSLVAPTYSRGAAVERSRAIAEFASPNRNCLSARSPAASFSIVTAPFCRESWPSGLSLSVASQSPDSTPQHHSNCPIKNRQPTRHGRRWKSGCIYHFPIRRLPARFRGFGMKIKQSLLEVAMRGKPAHHRKSHRLQPDVASGAIARSLLGPKPPKEICPIPTACP
jgi:hypothetical protein